MNQTILVISMFVFAFTVSMFIYSWISYQDTMDQAVRYRSVDKPWFTRLRWLWTMLVIMLAVIGYFTAVQRMSGVTLQPIVLDKGIDWPDPDEMKTVSDEGNNPTQLEVYQDKDLYHIRFMRRCDSCLTIDPGQIHYRYRSRDKTYVSDTADFIYHPRDSSTGIIVDTIHGHGSIK